MQRKKKSELFIIYNFFSCVNNILEFRKLSLKNIIIGEKFKYILKSKTLKKQKFFN